MNKDVQQAPDFTEDRHLDPLVKEFLKGINAGKPVESLSKEAARQVLSDAQSSVQVDLSGIVESEQTITENGLSRSAHGRAPSRLGRLASVLRLHSRRRMDSGRLPDPPETRARSGRRIGIPGRFHPLHALARGEIPAGAGRNIRGRTLDRAQRRPNRSRRFAHGAGRKQRRRQHGDRYGSSRQTGTGTADQAAASDVARRRLVVRHGLLRPVCQAAIPDRFADEMDVRPIHDRPAATARGLCLPVASHGRRASRPAADLHSGSRKRHLARRGRGARTQTVRGGRRCDDGPDTTE